MKSLFDKVSIQCSKLTTHHYSTSFSMGIYFLNKKLRDKIYAIYGFVRFADEIVDSFDAYNQKELLLKFKQETYEAIAKGISLNPILNSFQQVVNDYKIGKDLIDAFLNSMEMDLEKVFYTRDKFNNYILGSAEVVGLMCLQVFAEGDKQRYEELKPFAMRLGAAFQKINFLRDAKADFYHLGRNYFPDVDLNNFSSLQKKQIENEIEQDFKEAFIGIRKLPKSSQGGVYLAYVYYISLFKKIRNLTPSQIMTKRIRISNFEKLLLTLRSVLKYKLGTLN